MSTTRTTSFRIRSYALSRLDQFTPGTNLQVWLFTILRNLFHTEYRKRRREVEDPEGAMAGLLTVPPKHDAQLDFHDLRSDLAQLPSEQREALLLIGAEGLSYEVAARICGAAVGTIKSWVSRAPASAWPNCSG